MKILNTTNGELSILQITQLHKLVDTTSAEKDEELLIEKLSEKFPHLTQQISSTLLALPLDTQQTFVLAELLVGFIVNYDAVILPIGSSAFMFILATMLKGTGVIALFSHVEPHSRLKIVTPSNPNDPDREWVDTLEHTKWIIINT